MNEQDLLARLDGQNIPYQYHAHEAAFTCADVSRLGLDIDGADTKNLFLTDRANRFFLLVTTHDKRVDLKEFMKQCNLPKLSFGPPEKLLEYLGVEPGSVTILGVANDIGHHVELIIDEDIWAQERIQCHPLANTATIVIARIDLVRFLDDTWHTPIIVRVPTRKD